jgi:hypothetical protein
MSQLPLLEAPLIPAKFTLEQYHRMIGSPRIPVEPSIFGVMMEYWCNDGGRCSWGLPMDNKMHIPLDLPDVRIVEISKTKTQAWLIRVESTLKHTQCRNNRVDIQMTKPCPVS